jgi:hypothetical protein
VLCPCAGALRHVVGVVAGRTNVRRTVRVVAKVHGRGIAAGAGGRGAAEPLRGGPDHRSVLVVLSGSSGRAAQIRNLVVPALCGLFRRRHPIRHVFPTRRVEVVGG